MTRRNIAGAYCYRVKGLFVPYNMPETIDRDINNYISNIDQYAKRLDECFSRKDISGFITVLETIQASLQAVYAMHCLSYTSALIHAAKTHSLDYCQRLLQQAIADLLLLSIEMQKAQALSAAPATRYKQIERNEENARCFAAVDRLIDARDYEKALSVASGMTDMDDAFAVLADMIKTRQYDRAQYLANTMEKEHIGLIQNKRVGAAHKTVLAVDDRPDVLTNVSAALRGHFRVLGAQDGASALRVMQSQRVDLFILDIEMPGMDGFELARRIRADSSYAATPIVFLTANATRENITKGINLGVSDFIVKPSNHVNLLVKARQYTDD